MKVIIAGPFESKGRYSGGIASLLSGVVEYKNVFSHYGIEPIVFDTCRVARNNKTDGKIKIENIVNFVKIYKDIVKSVRMEKADIVYYHSSLGLALLKDLLALRHVKRKTCAKVIVHIHAADYEHIMTGISSIDRYIFKLLTRIPDCIVFLSSSTSDDFVKRGIPRDKTRVIYNYGRIDHCSPKEIEEKIGRHSNNLNILFVGSVEPMKGIFDLMDALKKISNECTLHVCGSFIDDNSEIVFKEKSEQLSTRVVFHGFVSGEEKRSVFLNSDVLVLPSYAEGMPVVILEAYQTGCAVISTTVGAIPEIVKEENGWLVQPGDVEALTSKLNEAIASPQILRKMQEHNYNESEKYSINSFIRQMADVCNEV